jgi:hypothetical protein
VQKDKYYCKGADENEQPSKDNRKNKKFRIRKEEPSSRN